MTYTHDKNPWKIAHRIDLWTLHEIAIANAEPKLTPVFT